MKKTIVDESLFAIRMLIVVLCVVCGAAPAWADHGGPHYAKVTVTATPTGQGKVYMTTDGDYVPESEDWKPTMSDTWNCGDGVDDEADSRTYYVHAQATSGNHFVKWSSNSSGSDSKSTAAKYTYSTSASGSSSSPTANNIYAIFEVNPTYTCTMLTSENGTFKYQYGESAEVTVTSEHSVTTDQNFTFTALPEAGYMLYGWYTKSGGTKTYFDYSSTTISSYALPGNVSIGVDFVPEGTPIFQIKGANKTYTDLNAAIAACGSATKTIVLINNGTLPAENYTIPANVTLLIPFDEGFTCYTTTPSLTSDDYLTPEVYRTLTMSPGATLTVNGAVSVSAKLSSRSGYGPNGATSGKYGAIKMLSEGNTKSKITLKSGAKLYSWGYVYGEGAVEALSGATVYEGFVITDWRGGNNTLDIYNKRSTYKVFPFNQYYIQNIEVPLTIHKGATETVYSSVYGNGSDNPLAITMVGDEGSGLFRLTGAGAKLTKWYDPLYDRQHYELEGAAAINAISFTAMGMTVSSSVFVLPITNNMDITVRNGATVSIAEDACIMPDASVTVEQGATMTIAKNVYVYDKQAYTNAGTYTTSRGGYPSAGPGRYAAGDYVHRIAYSPSWAALSNREIRRLQNMSSAHFLVNGTLNVSGKLYTTEGGADIFSTADGAAVNLVSGAGTANKTYQVDHEDYDAYYYTIPVTSAQLHHADGSYQATAGNAANTTWTYAHGHWGWCIIWRLEDGTELKRMYQPAQPNADWISSNAPETSKADEGTCSYVFNGWNTVTNTSQQEIILTADYTKTCAEYYDVLWKSEDGTETYETDENVGQGETTRYNGAAPVKADDKTNGFTYTFDGWTTEPNGGGTKYNIGETPAATGNATYYAHFAATEVAAIITANGVVSYYPSIADAFTAANASDYTPTIQVWRDAPNTPALTYTAKNHCTLDLNGHIVSGTEMPLLTINDEGFTFTVTDRTETKEGKLAGTSGVSQAFVVSLVSGVFRLEAGTVYGQNTGTGVMAGVYAGANREVIMTGGTIQVDANSGTGYGIFAQGKGTINGGTIRVESSAKSAYAVQAQGSNGNVTVTDGKFYAAGKTTVTCVLAKGGASLAVNGGYYNTNTNLATYLGAGCHVINLPASELPYQYKVGTGGYTVTFQNTDGTVLQSGLWENGATPIFTGATPTKPGDTGGEFIHSSWTPDLAPVTGDATYTAVYVPTPPVASVTINGTTTEYIHFSDAWTAANSATDASTLTLLQDVTVTTKLTYNNSNNKDCILDLNGHILTSNTPEQSPLHINNTNVTFTVTDGTEGKSGKLSLNTSSSSTIFGVYVQYGTFLLNGGTLEVTSSTSTVCGVTIHYGTFTMNGGTIHVKTTNNKDGRGIYANSTTTVNGGTILVEAGGNAYGIRHDGGIMTINDGKFSISGSTANVTTQTSATANMVIRGGYYTTKSQIYPTAPHYVFDLTSGAEYEEGYRYKVAEAYTLSWSTDGDEFTGDYSSGLIESGATIVAPNPTKAGYTFAGWLPAFTGTMPAANTTYTAQWAVASVTIGETTTLYTTFADAWSAVNSASAASTLKLLDDVDLTTGLEYTNASKNCILDLNGHIISGSATPLLKIAQNGITFTITDLSEAKEGRIECNTHINGQKWAVEVSQSTLRFEGGTIYAKNTHAGDLFIGIYSGASGVIEISGGNIHTVTTAANPAFCVLTFGTATISGGSFKVESGAAGYAVEAYGNNTNILITGGNFYATGSSAACVHRSKGTLTLRGGYYNTNTSLATQCATNYHVFQNDDATYPHKIAEGYTVTFNTNGHGSAPEAQLIEKNAHASEPTAPTASGYTFGGWYKEAACETPWNFASDVVTAATTLYAKWTAINYSISYELNGGSVASENPTSYTVESSAITLNNPTKANYVFVGWTGTDLANATTNVTISAGSTGDRSYTATWTPAVASVTVNEVTTYYTTFDDAWSAVNSATAASTIQLLQNVTVTSYKTYDNTNTQNCTLDLNGHTLSSTAAMALLYINKAGITYTITDLTESKSGTLHLESTSTDNRWCVYVAKGNLQMDAGTVFLRSKANTYNEGIRIDPAASTFTMNGGKVHVETSDGKPACGIVSRGIAFIRSGEIQVEASGTGYGIEARVSDDGYNIGNVTVYGGKFLVTGTTAACAYRSNANATLKLQGGYYNSDTDLSTYCATNYHVFPNDDATYLYKVAEGYNVTFNANGYGAAPATQLIEKNAHATTPVAPTVEGYTFGGWYKEAACEIPWNFASDVVTAATTLYAQWTVHTHKFAWDFNGGTPSGSYTEANDALAYGSEISYPTMTKTGYTFASWSSDATTMPDNDLIITASWTINQYTISFDSNGGSAVASITQDYNTAVTPPANPSRTGYTFNGWSPAVPNPMPAEDTECEAQWTRDTYTISYDLAGGSVASENPTSYTVESSAITLNNPTKANYVFAGWTGTGLGSATINVTISVGSTGDRSYTATWTPAVASVTVNSATTYYTTIGAAWTAVNNATAASTLTLLQDVTVTSHLTYNNSNTQNCTLDLNGHIISGSATPLLQITQKDITFTITDLTEAKEGRIECNTSSGGQKWAVEVSQSTLRFEGGTIYAKNTQAGDLFIGIYSGASGVIEISKGNIHTVTTAANPAYGVLTFGTATISGGSFKVESGAAGYAVEARNKNSNVTITGGNFYASGSSAACVHTEGSGASLTLQGGYYNSDTNLTPNCATNYHVFPNDDATYPYKVAEGYTVTFNNYDDTSLQSGVWEKGTTPTYSGETPTKPADAQYTYTFNGWSPAISSVTADATYTAQFSSTVNTYTVTWKDADGTTLETDANVKYGALPVYDGATPVKATDAEYAYAFDTWSPAVSAVTGDAVYTATYTTTPVVASVTTNAATTYYTSFNDAWTDVNSATAASTLTLLQDISGLSSSRTYNASHDLMLDLNGHTLSGSGTITSLFNISCTGHTFTVTDGSANKEGKISFSSGNGSTSHCVIVTNGTFVLEAGMMEATSSTASIGAVQVVGGTFTMNENGAVHAIYTGNVNGNNSRLVHAKSGTTTINGGSIRLESKKDAIGVVYSGGNVTFNGGLFNISALGTAAVTNQNVANDYLNIRGGYYSANTTTYFEPHVKTPYHIFPNSDATYIYRVAEAYTVTFNNYDGTSLQSGLWENGTTPTYSGETPTKPADAHYTYTFDGWSPAVSAVTANATYTAQFSSTVNTYTVTWKNADGTTLETDANVPYGTTPEYNGATPTKATDASYGYTFNGWSPAVSNVTGDVIYTATYTTTPVVASVTVNSTTTYYTSFADAWTAANSATAASTLTLLQDISGLSARTYNAAHDLTLDLNGHTLSGSGTSMFQIGCAGYTFTVTDGSANHNGKLSFTTAESSTSSFHCVIVNNGTFVLEAGTIEATSSTASIGAVQVVGGTFTMNENGAVHAIYTGNVTGKNSRLVHANGTNGIININGGSIRLESTKDAIGVVYSSGNVTFNGGLFNISALGTAAVTNQNVANDYLNIRGGYYSANTTTYFEPHVKTPYHIFPNSDATYIYRVAEAYTVTFNNYDGTSLQSGLWENGTTPTYSGETPTKPADAHYTYTFLTWSPAISSVTANATYTATYNNTPKPQESIVVNERETVTIDVNTETTTTIVHVSGTLEVAENATLTTNDLILEATPNSSGEIIGNVAVNQNAYFDLSQPGGFKARTWYTVAVPWQVAVPAYEKTKNGVYTKKGSGEFVQQELGRSFDLIYYDGARRATGVNKAWNYVEDDAEALHIMYPGRAYMIYLTADADIIRFERKEGAELHTTQVETKKYTVSQGVNEDYADWNGIANPATYHAYLNVGATYDYGQVYNADTKQYKLFNMSENKLVVGQPIFVQPAEETTIVANADSYANNPSLAPRRTNAQETSMTRYEVMFAPNEGDVTDRIIVRLNEEKEENAYVVGQDLVKMGVSDMVPQMWVDRYDSKMCINTVAPVNNKADYPLGISVQQSGAYDLFIDDQPDDETMLYLTYDGEAIWNLSYGGYVVNLEKGTNSHYGLRIVYAPQTATGIENVQRDNVQCTKVLMDDHVFIIRGGNIYTMDGQLVK